MVITIELNRFDISTIKNILYDNSLHILVINKQHVMLLQQKELRSFLNFDALTPIKNSPIPLISQIIVCNSKCYTFIILQNINNLQSAYNVIQNLTFLLSTENLEFSYIIFYRKLKIFIGILIESKKDEAILKLVEKIIMSEIKDVLSFAKISKKFWKDFLKVLFLDNKHTICCEDTSSFTDFVKSLVMLLSSNEFKEKQVKEIPIKHKKHFNSEWETKHSREPKFENYHARFALIEKLFKLKFEEIIFLEPSEKAIRIFQKDHIKRWYLTGIDYR